MRKLHVASLLALIGLFVLPASADQTALDCDKAVANYWVIAEFDNQAVREGYRICGTPALMAKNQMRVACSRVGRWINNE